MSLTTCFMSQDPVSKADSCDVLSSICPQHATSPTYHVQHSALVRRAASKKLIGFLGQTSRSHLQYYLPLTTWLTIPVRAVIVY